MEEKKFCKFCGEEICKDSIVCPKCGRQLQLVQEPKKGTVSNNKFYTNEWFMWIMLVLFAPIGIVLMFTFNKRLSKSHKIILSFCFGLFFLLSMIGSFNVDEKSNNGNIDNSSNNKVKVTVIDFNSMEQDAIKTWCDTNKITCNFQNQYSDDVLSGLFLGQDVPANKVINQESKITITYSLGKKPSVEYRNALEKAKSYSTLMHMSKQRIYDQLVSEYGEKFSHDAASYAVENVKVNWNTNALEKAKSYQNTMNMSKQRIYDQLVSEYGEKFTKEEATYAIEHLND